MPQTPEVADLPPALTRTSFSSFSTFIDCPEKWRQERLLRRPQLPMWAGVGGSAVHTTTERYDLALFEGGDLRDWQWATEFETAFHQGIAEEEESSGVDSSGWKVANKGTETYEWWLENGPTFAASWGRWREVRSEWELWTTPEGLPAIELEFVQDLGGTPVKGYIDRVMVKRDGSELLVIDLKSGRTMPETIDQLLVYAAFMELKWGIRPELGGYYDCRKARLIYPERLGVENTVDTAERIGWFISQAMAGEFLARPGRQCLNFCSFSEHCSAAKTLTYGLRKQL